MPAPQCRRERPARPHPVEDYDRHERLAGHHKLQNNIETMKVVFNRQVLFVQMQQTHVVIQIKLQWKSIRRKMKTQQGQTECSRNCIAIN